MVCLVQQMFPLKIRCSLWEPIGEMNPILRVSFYSDYLKQHNDHSLCSTKEL